MVSPIGTYPYTYHDVSVSKCGVVETYNQGLIPDGDILCEPDDGF
jgi:hypothetical protein